MTKLEKEMLDAISQAERYDENQEAINCAKVARDWIIKSVSDSSETNMQCFIEEWLKSNDI